MQTGIKEGVIGHTGHVAEIRGHILAIAAGAMGAEGAAATAETVTGVDARDAIETKRRKGTEHATRIKTEVKTRLRKRGTPGA